MPQLLDFPTLLALAAVLWMAAGLLAFGYFVGRVLTAWRSYDRGWKAGFRAGQFTRKPDGVDFVPDDVKELRWGPHG